MPVRCLAARSHDLYGNKISFPDIHKAVITILDGDYVLAQVEDIRTELSSDSSTLIIRVSHMHHFCYRTVHKFIEFTAFPYLIFHCATHEGFCVRNQQIGHNKAKV
jgi:hypothetical protein